MRTKKKPMASHHIILFCFYENINAFIMVKNAWRQIAEKLDLDIWQKLYYTVRSPWYIIGPQAFAEGTILVPWPCVTRWWWLSFFGPVVDVLWH